MGNLGAAILSKGAANWNAKTGSKDLKWGVKGGFFTGPGDPELARQVYCFQHEIEECAGTCLPLESKTDCYNRDGMIGARTLQEMFNAAANGTPQPWADNWKLSIVFPSGMKVTTPPPASHVKKTSPDKKEKKEEDSIINKVTASSKTPWIVGGVLAALATGAYFMFGRD